MSNQLFGASLGLVATMLVAACHGEDVFGPGFDQGIEGLALIGPQCPVQSSSNPCPDLPHEARIDVLTGRGDFVVRLRSDSSGVFRVGLRPGDYLLRPERGNPFPAVDDRAVTVMPNEFTDVVLSFDTGIR